MFEQFPTPHLVPFDGGFVLDSQPTAPETPEPKKVYKQRLLEHASALYELQRKFYAHDKQALLLIFQAMDAAGKDSTIRHVMHYVNPAGCQVYSFKQPSAEELDHDFLWRSNKRLPQRGRIGIFNRSYYEEVLVVRVHPEYLENQKLPADIDRDTLWRDRFEAIRNMEKYLAENGVVILKFWLNVSRDEQKRRFLARLDEPEKNWKFSASDVRERRYWDQYMVAYEDALNATSRPWAPWYAIPADNKPYARAIVAEIIASTLKAIDPRYPSVTEAQRARFAEARAELEGE